MRKLDPKVVPVNEGADPQQVIDDTLGGSPAAKAAWTQAGMTLDITGIVGDINVPTTIIVGDADKVETEPLLRRELASRISGTEFIVLPGVGHLSPLEARRDCRRGAACF